MKNKILDVKNLSVLIKDRFLLKNITFSLDENSCLGIVGEDKSGKTTLMKALAGSMPISDGQVFFCGKDIKSKISTVADINLCLDPPVFFKFQTVLNNLQYLSSLNGKTDKEKIIKTLNQFNLAHKLKKRVFSLSYYEKKLMALALAFLTQPKLLILDEPFKGLPEKNIEEIKAYIQKLKENGTTMILSSRNYEVIDEMCDNFIFMENKKIKEILSKDQCQSLSKGPTYAFVEVKYPHLCGKMIIEKFNLKVKLYGKKVLFECDENMTAEIVKFLTIKRIAIFKAGFLNKKSEKIFAKMTPFFKEESK